MSSLLPQKSIPGSRPGAWPMWLVPSQRLSLRPDTTSGWPCRATGGCASGVWPWTGPSRPPSCPSANAPRSSGSGDWPRARCRCTCWTYPPRSNARRFTARQTTTGASSSLLAACWTSCSICARSRAGSPMLCIATIGILHLSSTTSRPFTRTRSATSRRSLRSTILPTRAPVCPIRCRLPGSPREAWWRTGWGRASPVPSISWPAGSCTAT